MDLHSVNRRQSSITGPGTANPRVVEVYDSNVDSPDKLAVPEHLNESNIDIGFDEDAFFAWVRSNFYIPVCHNFVPKSGTKKCKCGQSREQHPDIANVLHESVDWHPSQHCLSQPTNAFGTINFAYEDTITMPRFVRVGTTSTDPNATYTIPEGNVEAIKALLLDHWKLHAPGLLISVTGGAKSFKLNKVMASDFQQGLMAAAKATSAWIITGGENCGVMSLVGEAVSMASFTSSIVAIGVTNWSKTLNRDMLDHKNAGEDLIVDYKAGQNVKGESSLDSHHTHFFLVDDGLNHKAGCELRYRIELQDIIQDMFQHEGETLPKICILVEGGETSVDCALNAVAYGNPLLIVRDTGRAADIICSALDNVEHYEKVIGGKITVCYRIKDNKIREVKLEIERHFHKYGSAVCSRIFEKVSKVAESFDMCSIYDTHDDEGLDFAILLSLIGRFTDDRAATKQMKLSILWDQPEVAKKFILSKHSFKASQLNKFLDMAIEYQSIEFIRLLLYQGADLKEYLTIEALTRLYNELPENTIVAKRLYEGDDDHPDIKLIEVGMLVEKILEGTYQSPFRNICDSDQDIKETFNDPYDLMVVYAALRGDLQMAKLFWEFSKAPTMCALVAYKIFHCLADEEKKSLQSDEDQLQELKEAATTFQDYAIGILNQCAAGYSRKHLLMFITTPRSGFSNINIVDMAATLQARKFVAHHAYQAYLTDIWMGDIQHNTNNFILLLCLLPPMPMLVNIYNKRQMTEEEMIEHDKEKAKQKDRRRSSVIKVVSSIMRRPKKIIESDHHHHHRNKTKNERMMRTLTFTERFKAFYSAPIIKFIWNVITHLLMLTVYGYSILFKNNSLALNTSNQECEQYDDFADSSDLASYISCYKRSIDASDSSSGLLASTSLESIDIILLIYFLSTIPIEIDQCRSETPLKITAKLKNHYNSMYDIWDLMAMTLFFIAFICKLTVSEWTPDPDTFFYSFNIGRICNILSFGLYTLRFMQFFEINLNLGPKIIMIKKMLWDLYFFIFILLIFLFAYCVTSEALMQPNRFDIEDYHVSSVILSMFERSFFNVFGEIDLDGINEKFLEHHCDELEHHDKESYVKEHIKNKTAWNVTNTMITDDMFANRGFHNSSECQSNYGSDLLDLFKTNTVPFIQFSYYLTFFILCIYLLISNIMLINLLIAIFSATYEGVEEESDVIFKYQRENVIKDFEDASPVPLPFTAIFYVYDVSKWLFELFLIKRRNKPPKPSNIDPEIEYKVGLIEAECRTLFMKDAGDTEQREHRLLREVKKAQQKTHDDLREVRKMIEDIQKQMGNANKAKITPVTELWKRIFSHKYSRESPYPGTDIVRFPVPDNKILWNISYSDYKPPTLDKPRLNMFDEPLDPYDVAGFNSHEDGINRISNISEYIIMDGKPLNPKGRTGLMGRGEQERWGPNHIAVPLVSRWAKKNGQFYTVKNMRVIEIVAIKKTKSELWDLPAGYIDVSEAISVAHKRTFLETTLGINETTGVEKLQKLQLADRWMQSGIILYKGYFDDARNTDNSWIEIHSVNYHLEDPPYPEGFEPGDFIEEVAWITLDNKTDMHKNNLWILKKACIHLGAYNPYKGEVLI